MGVFGNLFKKVTKMRIPYQQVMKLGPARWFGRNPDEYAKEGYTKNVIVYRCIDIISKGFASIPIEVKVGDDVVENHPLQTLLDNPNPTMSGSEFRRYVASWLLVAGNSYIEKIGPEASGSAPKELWPWRANRMRVVAQDIDQYIPRGYVFDDGKVKIGWDVDPVLGQSDILHWRSFNPLEATRWYGLSPIEAAAFQVDQHNEGSEWNMRMLQNSAAPEGILQSESILSDDEWRQIKARMDMQKGARNARESLVLEGGLEWQQTGLSPREMDWLQGMNLSSREIAAAFGVPTQVIPIQGDQTFANYEQARLALYEDTIIPLLDDYVSELNSWLTPLYGDNVTIVYNIDNIPALEAKRKEKWTSVKDAAFLNINEKRQALGYDPIGNPDDESNPHNQIWLPSGLLPITEDDDTDMEEPVVEEEEDEDIKRLQMIDWGGIDL